MNIIAICVDAISEVSDTTLGEGAGLLALVEGRLLYLTRSCSKQRWGCHRAT